MEVNGDIIETATVMFQSAGIRKIKMDDIAFRMGISKRTLYEQFTNKDNLIRYCLDNIIKKQREESEKILNNNNNVVEAIIAFLKKGNEILLAVNPLFFSDLKRIYPSIWHEKFQLQQHNNYLITKQLIEKGVKEGFYREDINVDMVARIFVEQLNIFSDQDFFSGRDFSVTEVFNNLLVNYTRGIATAKGIKLIDEAPISLRQTKRDE